MVVFHSDKFASSNTHVAVLHTCTVPCGFLVVLVSREVAGDFAAVPEVAVANVCVSVAPEWLLAEGRRGGRGLINNNNIIVVFQG